MEGKRAFDSDAKTSSGGGEPAGNKPPAYEKTAPSASQPIFRTRFASMSLHSTDCLRFLSFPPAILDQVRPAIKRTWPRGIQSERAYGGSHEIKLLGMPWQPRGDDAMLARRMVREVLAALHGAGWVLTLTTDVSKKIYDKDTLLFRLQDPAPARCTWCCVSFSRTDRVRLVDVPAEMHKVVAGALQRFGVSGHSPYGVAGVYEIRLHGTPWHASGTDTMRSREILLVLLAVLEEHGWSVYSSIDQKNASDQRSETDTWHCCRLEGWTMGMPVYHN